MFLDLSCDLSGISEPQTQRHLLSCAAITLKLTILIYSLLFAINILIIERFGD